MILVALTECAQAFRGKRGVWFVDNIAALMALVKGRSNKDLLDQMALQIHAALYALECWIYFEWIASEANWSDGVSRVGLDDPWLQTHRFEPCRCAGFPSMLLLPFRSLVNVISVL